VVLPCVPATTIGWRPSRNRRPIACGMLRYGMPLSAAATASGLAAVAMLPITTRSGRSSRFSARYPSIRRIPLSRSMVLIGG
jgi:hypothetical protein